MLVLLNSLPYFPYSFRMESELYSLPETLPRISPSSATIQAPQIEGFGKWSEVDGSVDPNEPGLAKRVVKGGSFLCSENYCTGYRPSARMATDPRSSSNHTGFRCVINKK